MSIFTEREIKLATSLIELSHSNPFKPERVEIEQSILGSRSVERETTWSWTSQSSGGRQNIALLQTQAQELLSGMRDKVAACSALSEKDSLLYTDCVLYTLYHRYDDYLRELLERSLETGEPAVEAPFYKEFRAEARYYYHVGTHRFDELNRLPHILALGFQLKRAFHFIINSFVGRSAAMSHLRASVWQSIVTHDTRRYSLRLYDQMASFGTLICGPSGTGKELVARAIAYSRYIPFDPKRSCFEEDFRQSFYPLSLSALANSVIESELFGHTRGSYTGANADRIGFFEASGPLGTVFLDEIGDVSAEIQVKLLRVLQTRSFQRLGDTKMRPFDGKIVAATNADLTKQMETGAFREDLYYRLCADKIVTPSLDDQIAGDPEELEHMLQFIAKRVVGESMAPSLAVDVHNWIRKELPANYPWPGNIRELEQCVRNIVIRNEYRPATTRHTKSSAKLENAVGKRSLKLNELIEWYCTTVYAETGSYEHAARKLGVDPRTLKTKINQDRLVGAL